MTVESREKQRTQALSDELESKQQKQYRSGDQLKDLKQQKVNIVDSTLKDHQQGSGKQGLDKSQWMGDL